MTRVTLLALLLTVAIGAVAACAGGPPAPGSDRADWIAVDLAVEYEVGVRLCALDDRGDVACSLNDEPVASGVPRDAWTDIAINEWFVCALRADGQVFCYGRSSRADWSDGYNPAPRQVFTQIDGNWLGFCGLLEDGETRCWNDRADPPRPPWGTPHTFVALGDQAICVIGETGRPSCRRGYPGLCCSAAPNAPQERHIAISVASYGETECVQNGAEQCSEAPTCALTESGEAYCWGRWTAEDWPPPPPGPFTAISVAPNHACALRPNGAAACWGRSAPTPPSDARFTALASIEAQTCGITTEAALRCWE